MLFIETTNQIYKKNSYLFRFSAVEKLVFTDQELDASPYVCSNEEAALCVKEYQDWCSKFSQPVYSDLIAEVSGLESAKSSLLQYIDTQTAKFEDNLNKEMYFTSSLGFKVNGDRRTKDNLQDLITFFDLQAKEGKIQYRDYDNQDQALTKEQLQTLLTEHVTNGQMLYNVKWQLQSKVKDATSLDDLHNITIAFPMTDFSAKAEENIETGLAE